MDEGAPVECWSGTWVHWARLERREETRRGREEGGDDEAKARRATASETRRRPRWPGRVAGYAFESVIHDCKVPSQPTSE